MKIFRILIIFFMLFILFHFGQTAPAKEQKSASEIEGRVQNMITDIVDKTIEKANKTVESNTDVDLSKRGYESGKKHPSFPDILTDEIYRELDQLQNEHDRNIYQFEEELNRKLNKVTGEVEKIAADQDTSENLPKLRTHLEKTVNAAYAGFEKKIGEENRRVNEKRKDIIEKIRNE